MGSNPQGSTASVRKRSWRTWIRVSSNGSERGLEAMCLQRGPLIAEKKPPTHRTHRVRRTHTGRMHRAVPGPRRAGKALVLDSTGLRGFFVFGGLLWFITIRLGFEYMIV